MARKAEHIYCLAPYNKFANPYTEIIVITMPLAMEALSCLTSCNSHYTQWYKLTVLVK